MNSVSDANKKILLDDILNIDKNNDFLNYIVERIKSNDYRGWHISQHNRYDLDTIEIVLKVINEIVGEQYFEIPPGDYNKNDDIPKYFNYKEIVNKINEKLGKGTINSIKKNFFPDLDKMGFIERKKIKIYYGKLTKNAIELINSNNDIIKKYKKFSDGIDKLFGEKISELANRISLSNYRNEAISIYEFMFILSDKDDTTDKIKLLDEYRKLEKHKKDKVIELIKKYANPKNFCGKRNQRDFHNWKNQAQQIMILLKTTVYFEVDSNKSIRLNIGKTGFYQESVKRSKIPKKEYFEFHSINKENKFELHHIIPMKYAKNKEEAKLIDNHLNLIYIHKNKHKEFSKKDKNIVMEINPDEAVFSDLNNEIEKIKSINNTDARYTKEKNKIEKLQKHNTQLLKSIFEFEK